MVARRSTSRVTSVGVRKKLEISPVHPAHAFAQLTAISERSALCTRRARVDPSEVGLSASPRRRTTGLRREEVVQLAGISVAWYTWLEQKRLIRVSPLHLGQSCACAAP